MISIKSRDINTHPKKFPFLDKKKKKRLQMKKRKYLGLDFPDNVVDDLDGVDVAEELVLAENVLVDDHDSGLVFLRRKEEEIGRK